MLTLHQSWLFVADRDRKKKKLRLQYIISSQANVFHKRRLYLFFHLFYIRFSLDSYSFFLFSISYLIKFSHFSQFAYFTLYFFVSQIPDQVFSFTPGYIAVEFIFYSFNFCGSTKKPTHLLEFHGWTKMKETESRFVCRRRTECFLLIFFSSSLTFVATALRHRHVWRETAFQKAWNFNCDST